ncbi:COG1470 family protein [Pseudochryseolinea flava]|uniref:Alpha-galactosidase NEW3 domain-containing protein n=1 Tax=Pseudochryseolinea flava TaxID=2059302 RepID=A0A364Y8C7_9BACT|nr:NEW3 domain-containing protein [Pseudochryseolinea flava]RAW02609.1 hypothetical protein DQQ10_00400 [Pseudochryseolinea flava]
MKQFLLPRRTLFIVLLFTSWMTTFSYVAVAETAVTLYTPFTKISVPPGQSIDYTIDVINNSVSVKNATIQVVGLPGEWSYSLKSGGWTIGELSVLPKERKNLTLHIDVPQKVNKGSYSFRVVAPGMGDLRLIIVVSEQGTFKTELSTRQPNMEGNATALFTYNAELRNRTGDKQLYGLRAQALPGWNVAFKWSGKQVTAVPVEANQAENITVEIDPPDGIEAGTYRIPVEGVTSASSARMELEVVITGSYQLELTTPSGLLSASITAGDEKRIELEVRNTGSTELRNIKFSHAAPANWEVTFQPTSIDKLEAGRSSVVYATIKADRNAIPGDYVTTLEGKCPEASSKSSFRISVKTSMLYGWIGVLIIAAVAGGIYYLFKKYGRR